MSSAGESINTGGVSAPRAVALAAFEKWSNYLLVTTVAAAGWVVSSNVVFTSGNLKSAALWCFGISIVFGIFTLALVPLVAQDTSSEPSIYRVEVEYHLFGKSFPAHLTQACRPQHVTFIGGVLLYCLGTAENLIIGAVILVFALVYGFLSKRESEVGTSVTRPEHPSPESESGRAG